VSAGVEKSVGFGEVFDVVEQFALAGGAAVAVLERDFALPRALPPVARCRHAPLVENGVAIDAFDREFDAVFSLALEFALEIDRLEKSLAQTTGRWRFRTFETG